MRFYLFLIFLLWPMAVMADDVNDLIKALEKRLVEIEREQNSWWSKNIEEKPLISFEKRTIKEGDTDPNIPKLRARLKDYMPDTVTNQDMFLFGSDLTEGVKAFQAYHAMKADGIVGPKTLAVINRTLEQEKAQIERNLQRLNGVEWLGRPDLRIDVDVTRYILTAYEKGKPVFEMPVVVGTTERQTNIFSTVMTGVRINPGWTLPPTIKAEDYIPKLRTNPEWVSEKGVMIYANWDRDSQPIDPTLVDWNFLTDNQIKAMRFYKMAGDSNPLGRYRFLMHNEFDIYLHDTNQKYLFDRTARAYSSGCVRVEDPRRLVEYLLADDPDWTAEKLDEVLEKGETYDLGATRSIPVYFDYKTAWLNAEGDLVLGEDIYNLDKLGEDDKLTEL